MSLLARYLLRQLVAPFCFALAALTSIMLLNQLAKRFGALIGKGLPWSVIAEVFALSLPFILAMTLPMAVLVAVLYTFSHLAADSEVTALRASGVSVPRILGPVLVWGIFMAGVNFAFVDQVLPRSNARLRALLIDIGRKKPTFEMREQVINEVPPSKYFLRAGRIDAATGRLRGLTIYDVGDQAERRVIYADSGLMAYAPNQRDLSLQLHDGVIHEYRSNEPGRFAVTTFSSSTIRIRDVYDVLDRNTSDQIRGDREMSSCEMMTVVREARTDGKRAARERARLMHRDLRELTGLPQLQPDTVTVLTSDNDYCGWLARTRRRLLPDSAKAAVPAGAVGTGLALQSPTVRDTAKAIALPAGTVVRPPVHRPVRAPALSAYADVALTGDRIKDAQLRANRYLVEIHKKWAISAACVSFVLVGIAMALRFPRGGMGLVIGGGLAAFSVYYVGLTAGEALADRGFVPPWVAMWSSNLIVTLAGIWGLAVVNREPGSIRGGGGSDGRSWGSRMRQLFGRAEAVE
ncbi:MAG TPA: LptF/LptG family permease [Gemmatimonadales bacterium]|nr:LptF/LptG family permease [Gemmatimonadales bacterium]